MIEQPLPDRKRDYWGTIFNTVVPDDNAGEVTGCNGNIENSALCESASRHIQSGEGHSMGLLRDCEIFAFNQEKVLLHDCENRWIVCRSSI